MIVNNRIPRTILEWNVLSRRRKDKPRENGRSEEEHDQQSPQSRRWKRPRIKVKQNVLC